MDLKEIPRPDPPVPPGRLFPLAILIAGFLLRLGLASFTYLNPDEAMHYFLARQSSLADAYHASLTSAHPPLLILFLHYWRMLGDSELLLRLPSVIAGTLFCWILYQWWETVADSVPPLVVLILLSFSPTLVSLSAEIRQYALLLLFCALSLQALDTAVLRDSTQRILLSSFWLCLALLTHYSAFLFAFVLGIYALLRFWSTRPRAIMLAAWVTGQSLAVTIGYVLYRSHISRLKGTGIDAIADTWLRKSFFHPGQQSLLAFAAKGTFLAFDYLFAQPVVGGVAFILFLIALFLAFWDPGRFATAKLSLAAWTWYTVGPLVLACVLGMTGTYPYGGTRHDVFLVLFLVPGISLGLTGIATTSWRATALALAIVLVSWIFLLPPGPHIRLRDQKITWMIEAVKYVHTSAAQKSIFVLDNQSTMPFRYYFCRDEAVHFGDSTQGPDAATQLIQFRCTGYRVLAAHPANEASPQMWTFSPDDLSAVLRRASSENALVGRSWFFQTGWGIENEPALRAELARLGCPSPREFGRNILVCPVEPPHPDS